MWNAVDRGNMGADSAETTRTTVQTYLPAYQKELWQEHADRLDMSLSEFVRTMVQSGRRGFLDDGDETINDEMAENDTPAGPSTELEDEILQALSTNEHLSWSDLVDAVVGDVEDRIEDTLQELQTENRVQYSGRHGGYTLTDE